MITPTQRKREDRERALLWLFIGSRGLLDGFKEFYRLHRSKSMEEIDNEFKNLINSQDNESNSNSKP